MRFGPVRLCLVSIVLAALPHVAPAQSAPQTLVGDVEGTVTLPDAVEVRGLAFDSAAGETRLLVLDRSGSIFAYRRGPDAALTRVDTIQIPPAANGTRIDDPRGLALGTDSGRPVLHVLNWTKADGSRRGEVWTFPAGAAQASVLDLSVHDFRIGEREVFGIVREGDRLLVSTDSSSYGNERERVRRGIVELRWVPPSEGRPRFVKHMPNAGRAPSHALTMMTVDGARYLWGTAGSRHLYVADARTGRGLFALDMPGDSEDKTMRWGLAFGDDALWVAEPRPGPDRLHRVNVTRNPEAVYEGPRILRHLVMTIASQPEGPAAHAGAVTHTFSRPYGYGPLRNQGVWLETERVSDTSEAPNATVGTATMDPAGDLFSRQVFRTVAYSDAPARPYSSKYEIDMWMNPSRQFVYPHLVNVERDALAGTDYLADDPVLYNLADRETYEAFLSRVRAYIEHEYGEPADMKNPYWAARNIVDYILDHYYYPIREKGVPAAVDYDRGHYDANPGNLKADLSRAPYNRTQIIACSGTSVTVGGALRYLGIPARWLGTGTPQPAGDWDRNRNGLLDEGETAPATNGHRVNQVWLGSRYGWVPFDATPLRPANADFDVPPPPLSQWVYMTRSAAGLGKANRIVFNVASTFVKPLYREFECNDTLAVNNDCGGDQRYNLQGQHEKIELWKLPRHRIAVQNLLFIDPVTVSGPPARPSISWTLKGDWKKDPGATVSVFLQRVGDAGRAEDVASLATGLRPDAGSVTVDLSKHAGPGFRVIVRKDGDPETGGHSAPFDLRAPTATAARAPLH